MGDLSRRKRFDRSEAFQRVRALAGSDVDLSEAMEIIVGRILQGVQHPPTDLDTVCKKMGVESCVPADIPIAGELRRDGHGFKVVYSRGLTTGRRRFTIAHELGHALLHSSPGRSPRKGLDLERVCDMFATALLMPRSTFLDHVGPEITIRALFDLSKVFQTSLSATAMRCAELNGVSVFEAERERIVWSRGMVRNSRVQQLDPALQHVVLLALQGSAGEESIYLGGEAVVTEWRVQYAPLGSKRAMVILIPLRRCLPLGAVAPADLAS